MAWYLKDMAEGVYSIDVGIIWAGKMGGRYRSGNWRRRESLIYSGEMGRGWMIWGG